MLQFDDNGLLVPDAPMLINLTTFENFFVFNEHRQQIFDEYLDFLNTLKGLALGSFYQWLNGSFVTLSPKPKDLDVVTFVDFGNLPKHENVLERKLIKTGRLDCYFVISYPEDHPSHSLFQSDSAEWLFLFSTTKRNIKTGKKDKKGFIQLNF